jgi:hypothetical protein
MTTALIRLCERFSDRALIFGLACFMTGSWVGRFTAHKGSLLGMLGG